MNFKIWTILLLFFKFYRTEAATELKYTSVTCEVLNKDAFASNCSFTDKRLFLTLNFLKSFNKFHVRFDMFALRDNEFQQAGKSVTINWCALMAGEIRTTAFVKASLEGLKKSSPDVFHLCPYKGVHQASNVTVGKRVVTMLPAGTFRMQVTVLEKKQSLFVFREDILTS